MAASDNNTVSILVQGGVSATALAFFSDSIMKMIPWLIVAVPLIVLDLIWGIKAAKYRGDRIRFSTAFRRTFGKGTEYFCWVVLASTLSIAFGTQWVEWAVLGVVILNEFSSIIGNYLETKGLEVSWKYVFNSILNLGGQKVGVDASGVDTGKFVRPIEKRPRNPLRNEKGQFVRRKK